MIKIIKLRYPGVLRLRQSTRQLDDIHIEKDMYLKIEISDKPFKQNKKEKPKEEPKKPKISILSICLIIFTIIFLAYYVPKLIKEATKTEEIKQEVPMLQGDPLYNFYYF